MLLLSLRVVDCLLIVASWIASWLLLVSAVCCFAFLVRRVLCVACFLFVVSCFLFVACNSMAVAVIGCCCRFVMFAVC